MRSAQKTVLAIVAIFSMGVMVASYATAMGMGPDKGCAMAGFKGKKMADPARMDGHLDKMKKELNISAEQENAWSLFADTIKQQKTEMMSAMQEQSQQTSSAQSAKPAPDSISEHVKSMKQRVTGMEAVASAMQQLYTVLTPQQREILDSRFGQGMHL